MKTVMAPALAAVVALAAGPRPQEPARAASGFDPSSFDRSVRPQDDLYRYVNGRWLDETVIPDDRVSYSAAAELIEKTNVDLRAIVEDLAARDSRRSDSRVQQVVDMFTSMVDEAAIERRGLTPLQPMLQAVDRIDSLQALGRVAGELSATSTAGPFFASLGTHPRDPGAPAVYLAQGGLLLDRERYLGAGAADENIRREYQTYLSRIFRLTARARPDDDAEAVLALEIEIAKAQVPEGAGRPSAPMSLRDLQGSFAGFDWMSWARPQGIDRVGVIVVAQPEFFRAFAALGPARPITTWRAWLAARYLTAM